MDDKNKIELRSEKVRNIIGKIPPLIIRTGISMIFSVVVLLLISAYSYRFEETIVCNATIFQDSMEVKYEIKVPTNKVKKIELGQRVDFLFQNTHNLTSTILSIDTVIHINKSKSYYNVTGTVKESELVFDELINTSATIFVGKVNVIEYVLNK